GQALAQWLKEQHPALKPRRILDIGCTVGHNIVPVAQAFPDAEVVAIDVAAPMLRYAHARARALGVNNIVFRRVNGQAIGCPAGPFGLITPAMCGHEGTSKPMPRKLQKINRRLAQGGLAVQLEQPQYHGMDPYEQFILDWDASNNNEPFWSVM